MRMHWLRVWNKVDIILTPVLAIPALYWTMTEQYKLVILFLVYLFAVPGSGIIIRTYLNKRMNQRGKDLGLESMGYFRWKETETEIWYEFHIRVPDQPEGKTINEIQIKLLRGFIRDAKRLHEFALTHKKDVVIMGTSHGVLCDAWIKAWERIGIQCEISEKNMDPNAAYSKGEWKDVTKKFYGQGVTLPHPDRREWKTVICRIKNIPKPIVLAAHT